jgi:hypothetical protein
MSTCYRFEEPVPFEQLRNLPSVFLEDKGFSIVPVRDNGVEKPMDTEFMLRDMNGNHLHVYTGDGTDTGFTRWGSNDVNDLISALSEHFDLSILSEHDNGYFDNVDREESCGQITLNLSELLDESGNVGE